LQIRLRTCKCGFFAANAASLQRIRNNIFFVWTCKALSESIYFVHISKKICRTWSNAFVVGHRLSLASCLQVQLLCVASTEAVFVALGTKSS
jgi:hypothetical protein